MLLLTPLSSSVPAFIHVYLEGRERFERHVNPTFRGPANANRSDLYNRYRVGLQLTLSPQWSAVTEYQNASDLFWTRAYNGISHNSDLSLGYGEYRAQHVDLTVGRQKIILGQMRLIGPTEWTNLSRSFDVARVRSGQWDVWGGTLGMASNDTKTVRLANATYGDRTYGTTSLIVKHDKGVFAAIDEQTLDHFGQIRVGNTTFDEEAAIQVGSNNLKDQRAWAYHARISQAVFAKTSFSLETDSASGGGNPTTSRTFDNLYPSNHGLYGLADTTGWKNMNYFAARLENHSFDPLTLRLTDQSISLRSASDAWYGFSGAPNPRQGGIYKDATGRSGTHLGEELDLEAIYDLKRLGNVAAGLAWFNPGDFVKNLSHRSDSETFAYLQYQARF